MDIRDDCPSARSEDPVIRIDRRHFLTLGLGAFAAGCAGRDGPQQIGFASNPPLVPMNLSRDRIMRVTVCTRPFRPAGPRIEAEAIAGKRVVHNYGHGGSGWSLSWGCAQEAAALALAEGATDVAIIGAGAMGLTTAVKLIEHGIAVTIYAKEFPAETPSARATGVWSPSSRIGLADAVDANFEDRWTKWARTSYDAHQTFVGRRGDPVEFIPQFALPRGADTPRIPATRDFLHLDGLIGDLTPPSRTLSAGAHPFPTDRVYHWRGMTFNVASYAEDIMRSFLLRGGRMIRRAFPDRAAILALPHHVIVNCTGFDAGRLWSDPSVTPVRGQISWLMPQREARYGVFYRNVLALSRRDGLIVQYLGPNDDWGYGDATEVPNMAETQNALTTLRSAFGKQNVPSPA